MQPVTRLQPILQRSHVRGLLVSTLRSELVERIKELNRATVPGPAAALSRVLDVSRTPVLAALKHLQLSGILARHPRGGFLVTQVPSQVVAALGGDPEANLYGRILRDIVMDETSDAGSESALMRHYGVGRGEILQVLRRLVREGLAEPLPGRGWTMLSINVEQLARSYYLRSLLEPAMLGDRNYRPDLEALARLRIEHRAALDSLSPDSPWQALFELDAGFHEVLASGAGNEMIMEIMRRQSRLRRLAEFAGYCRLERVRASMQEHVAIIDALLAGDWDWAAALMRQHLAVSHKETEEHFDDDRRALGAAAGLSRVA